jgi:hypothetical protein
MQVFTCLSTWVATAHPKAPLGWVPLDVDVQPPPRRYLEGRRVRKQRRSAAKAILRPWGALSWHRMPVKDLLNIALK